jgi:UDP-arabinose 4-epimerase
MASSTAKPILVTGGAGYIGSHVCKALHVKGYLPIAYDDLSHGHEWAVQWGPFIQGNIHDTSSLSTVIEHYGPIGVIHLAGVIHAREASQHPSLYYYQNVEGSRNVLQALLENGIGCIVFASSASVYGHAKPSPITEEYPKKPINAYGKSKWAVEEMLADFEKAHGLQFAALRLFNACGADPDGEIGEAHLNETHLIPLAIEAAIGQSEPLALFGKGQTLRDFVHVTDIASAHVAALEHLLAEKGSLCLNIGSGQGHTLLEVLQVIEKVLGQKVPHHFELNHEEESKALIANCEKAKALLRWEPRYSDMASIIQTAWKWHEQKLISCS